MRDSNNHHNGYVLRSFRLLAGRAILVTLRLRLPARGFIFAVPFRLIVALLRVPALSVIITALSIHYIPRRRLFPIRILLHYCLVE